MYTDKIPFWAFVLTIFVFLFPLSTFKVLNSSCLLENLAVASDSTFLNVTSFNPLSSSLATLTKSSTLYSFEYISTFSLFSSSTLGLLNFNALKSNLITPSFTPANPSIVYL